jgi:hypothetical protein
MPKVILSRKGFDSSAGGKSSFIYGDCLITLPIPNSGSGITYDRVRFDDNTKLDRVMKEVGITDGPTECHLDPDLHKSSLSGRHPEWKASFGQADIPEKVLKKNNVGPGDIFLFYGWFKAIDLKNGMYKYIHNAPNLHVIFGYLKVDEVVDLGVPNTVIPEYMKDHPHVVSRQKFSNDNRIYTGKNAGLFHFNNSLVLTRKGESRSRWELPAFFENENFMGCSKISHLSNGNIGIDFIGRNNQELLITETIEVVEWAENLIERNRLQD